MQCHFLGKTCSWKYPGLQMHNAPQLVLNQLPSSLQIQSLADHKAYDSNYQNLSLLHHLEFPFQALTKYIPVEFSFQFIL